MDAFWTRYFPAMYKLRELLANKVIGDVMLVTADFGGRGRSYRRKGTSIPIWPAAPCLM